MIYKTTAVVTMKTMIEANKAIVSFRKYLAVIVDSFVVLYITAMAAVKGRSHNAD